MGKGLEGEGERERDRNRGRKEGRKQGKEGKGMEGRREAGRKVSVTFEGTL